MAVRKERKKEQKISWQLQRVVNNYPIADKRSFGKSDGVACKSKVGIFKLAHSVQINHHSCWLYRECEDCICTVYKSCRRLVKTGIDRGAVCFIINNNIIIRIWELQSALPHCH